MRLLVEGKGGTQRLNKEVRSQGVDLKLFRQFRS